MHPPRDPRYDQVEGDGPAITRTGFVKDVASKYVAGSTSILVTDEDERNLLWIIRSLGIDSRRAIKILADEFNRA